MSDLLNLTLDLDTVLRALPALGALSLLLGVGWTAYRSVRGVCGLLVGVVKGGLELLALAVPGGWSVRPTPAIASYTAASALLMGGAGLTGWGQGGQLGALTGAGIAAALTGVVFAWRTMVMHDAHTLAIRSRELGASGPAQPKPS